MKKRKAVPSWTKKLLSEAESVLMRPSAGPRRWRMGHAGELPELGQDWTFADEVVGVQEMCVALLRRFYPQRAEDWQKACSPPHFRHNCTVGEALGRKTELSHEPDPLPDDALALAIDVEEGLRTVRLLRILLTYGPEAGVAVTTAAVFSFGYLKGSLLTMIPARFAERYAATGVKVHGGGHRARSAGWPRIQLALDRAAAADPDAGICDLRRRAARRCGVSVRTVERRAVDPRG